MSRDEFEQEDWDDGYDEGYSAGKDDGYEEAVREGEDRIGELEEELSNATAEIEKLEDACLVCKTVLSQAEQ